MDLPPGNGKKLFALEVELFPGALRPLKRRSSDVCQIVDIPSHWPDH